MPIQHPSTVPDPVRYSPTDIFDTFMPKVLKIQKEIALQLNAVCVFKISGEGGGHWTLDLPNLTVLKEAAHNADLELEMNVEDFGKMLSGKLDAAEAFANKRVKFSGRIELLPGVAALLTPGEG